MNMTKVKPEMQLSRVLLATLLMMGGVLHAAVVDYRAEVRQAPDLIHHYTFEGRQQDLDAPRLADRAGTADLSEQITSSSVPPLSYDPGYDALSVAGTSSYKTNVSASGQAWMTTNAISLPSTMTVECVVRINEWPVGITGSGVITTRETTDNRGYYLWLTQEGQLAVHIGSLRWTVVESVIPGHWYYVVSTYAKVGNKVTVNCYYADLSVDGPLTHALDNKISNGTYGTEAFLCIGTMRHANAALGYFAPCSMDEVAIYNTAHEFPAISNRWEALRMEAPTVEYREIFPNDDYGAYRQMPCEGWQTYYGTNAIAVVENPTTVVLERAPTAFDEDLLAVASFPTSAGVTNGYLNNHSGPTNVNYLYWTDEMTNRLDVSWIKMAMFDCRVEESRILRLALRVDTNATPDEVEDDVWFVGADFDNSPGTSVIPIKTYVWRRYWVDQGENEWTTLDFVPESHSYLGDTKVALPTNGVVTAFGLFQDLHTKGRNMRIDNFTVYARRIYPPPPPRGTVIMVQ